MKRWRKSELSDLVVLQRGFDITKAQQQEGIVPIISSSGVSSYHNEAKCKAPGVITGRKGTLGKVFYSDIDYWPHDTTLWVKDFKNNIPKYSYYFLKLLKLETYDVGASNPTLNRNHIHKLRINIPPSHIQRKIAVILSAYDDLIENNNRRITILEKMAEELYREWFVRLRFPGHEKVKIVKGVPEGWEVKRIGELVAHQIGGGWGQESPSGPENRPVYIIRGTDFKNIEKGDFSTAPLRYEKQTSIESRTIKHGDILLENSVNAQSRCAGNTIIITEQMLKEFDHPVIPASFCKLIRFRDARISFYIWKHLRCLFDQGLMESFQNVATNGIANFQMARFLSKCKIKIPKNKKLTESFWSFDSSNQKAVLTCLRTSRNRLLFRLMSGKIDVENLDIQFPASMDVPDKEEKEASH